ncbi:MAG: DNA ligase [Ornithinimicrobium sp.]|uniref:ATP-dependent DNA ligase n=1 Tax=Ornithinimicrobium sp. TaxID=1977084 RepID=UPI0017EE38C4|nr:DNA ligase [Actinomycetota bacterium]
MRPMLATPGSPGGADPGAVPTGPGWTHEVKWDGVRLLAHAGHGTLALRTRSGRDVAGGFPELAGLAGIAEDIVLDGEAVAFVDGRPVFAQVVDRVHLGSAEQARTIAARRPATYLIFDLLRLDGLDLTGLPWHRRRAALEALVPQGLTGRWQVPPTYADGSGLLAATQEQGLEGIVSKRVDAPYRPGVRSADWVKFPHRRTRSYVVGGWRPETGSARLGALLVGLPVPAPAQRLTFRGRVGSGLAGRAGAALARVLADVPRSECSFLDPLPSADRRGSTWLRPEVVVDVTSLGTTPAGRLRQPAYQAWRPDLTPAEL